MSSISFQDEILQGIPKEIPPKKDYDKSINHAPRENKYCLLMKKLALKNALRYFPIEQHKELIEEFAAELEEYGRIYMYRYRRK